MNVYVMNAWPPPNKKTIQIKHTPAGRWSVRCRHGWELADDVAFALTLWTAAWRKGDKR